MRDDVIILSYKNGSNKILLARRVWFRVSKSLQKIIIRRIQKPQSLWALAPPKEEISPVINYF